MTFELDRGSAPVEFSLVSTLVVAVTLAVLQVVFVAHVRAIAVDSAIAGAARAALADTTDADGVARTRELIDVGLAAGLVRGVTSSAGALNGHAIVAVDVTVAIPVIGPWLTVGETTVTGRAFREDPQFGPGNE